MSYEMRIVTSHHEPGTTTDHTWVDEFTFPVRLKGVKVSTDNATAITTLAVSGGATIAAAAIGQSDDPNYLEPTTPQQVAADTAIVFTLDADGAGSTTATNLSATAIYLTGTS